MTTAEGESRPGWKILRVMGNLFNLDGFDYMSSDEVNNELKQQCRDIQLNNAVECMQPISIDASGAELQRIGDVPIYAIDALVRRSSSLQKTKDAIQNYVRINRHQAEHLGVVGAEKVKVTQQGGHTYLPMMIDDGIPDGCVWISAGVQASITLGDVFGPLKWREFKHV